MLSSFLLASLLVAGPGCSGDISQSVAPDSVGPPDLAFNDFNDGILREYTYSYPISTLDFPDDPTGFGRGKVARFHYVHVGSADVNRSIQYTHAVTWGDSIYFKGDVYFPLESFDLPALNMGRKLLYWQQKIIIPKYGANRTYYAVLHMEGHRLGVEIGNQDQVLDHVNFFDPSICTWYTVEVLLRNQSAPGVADGVITVWIDGVKLYTNTALSWVPSSWIGVPVPGGNATLLDASDLYFNYFQVGDQVNYDGAYDEYRYWDDVGFSTRRIGK